MLETFLSSQCGTMHGPYICKQYCMVETFEELCIGRKFDTVFIIYVFSFHCLFFLGGKGKWAEHGIKKETMVSLIMHNLIGKGSTQLEQLWL